MRIHPILSLPILALLTAASGRADDAPARLVEPHVDPVLPHVLELNQTNGFAVVEAIVSTDGKLLSGRVLAASQSELMKTALDTAKGWRYTPAVVKGKTVEAVVGVPVWYPGEYPMTDDALWPLVQACQYIAGAWAEVHGYSVIKDLVVLRAKGDFSSVTLVRDGETNHIKVYRGEVPKDIQDAPDLIDSWIGKADFPEKTLGVLTALHGISMVLPVLHGKNPKPDQ